QGRGGQGRCQPSQTCELSESRQSTQARQHVYVASDVNGAGMLNEREAQAARKRARARPARAGRARTFAELVNAVWPAAGTNQSCREKELHSVGRGAPGEEQQVGAIGSKPSAGASGELLTF